MIPVVDVTAGVRLALDVLSEPGPMVMPVPAYAPQLAIAGITGRERVDLVVDPDAERAELDLDRLDALFAEGARTVLLTQPHNPWGRVFTRAELEGVRDVVVRHGARVVTDEIHAPLVLPGAEHVPYLSIEGTADHTVAVVAASKAFNTAGLRCAQIVAPDHTRASGCSRRRGPQRLLVAARAWWPPWRRTRTATRGWPLWSSGSTRSATLLAELLATHLPLARMRPLEATYLAWIDLRGYGHADPAAVALSQGRVRVAAGHDYQPGLEGHIRLNVATSPERLTEIVHRLAIALTPTGRLGLPVNITVIGCGYLGATHAASMAELGHDVLGVEIDPDKRAALAGGRVPFYEPGLEELLARQVASGRLRFTDSYEEAGAFADLHFVCVGTPQLASSMGADVSYVDAAVASLAPHLTRPAYVVGKSTVPVGTAARLAAHWRRARPPARTPSWCGTPSSCARASRSRTPCGPDRVVVGVASERAEKALRDFYAPITDTGHPDGGHRLRHRRAGEGLRQRVPGHQDLLHQRRRRGVRGRRRRRRRPRRRDRPRRPDRPPVPQRRRRLRRRLPAQGHPRVRAPRRRARRRGRDDVPAPGRRHQPAPAAAGHPDRRGDGRRLGRRRPDRACGARRSSPTATTCATPPRWRSPASCTCAAPTSRVYDPKATETARGAVPHAGLRRLGRRGRRAAPTWCCT